MIRFALLSLVAQTALSFRSGTSGKLGLKSLQKKKGACELVSGSYEVELSSAEKTMQIKPVYSHIVVLQEGCAVTINGVIKKYVIVTPSTGVKVAAETAQFTWNGQDSAKGTVAGNVLNVGAMSGEGTLTGSTLKWSNQVWRKQPYFAGSPDSYYWKKTFGKSTVAELTHIVNQKMQVYYQGQEQYGNKFSTRPNGFGVPDCFTEDSPGDYAGIEDQFGDHDDDKCLEWDAHPNAGVDARGKDEADNVFSKAVKARPGSKGTGELIWLHDLPSASSNSLHSPMYQINGHDMTHKKDDSLNNDDVHAEGVGMHNYCRFPAITFNHHGCGNAGLRDYSESVFKSWAIDCVDKQFSGCSAVGDKQDLFDNAAEPLKTCLRTVVAYYKVQDAARPWCLGGDNELPKTCNRPALMLCQKNFGLGQEKYYSDGGTDAFTAFEDSQGYDAVWRYLFAGFPPYEFFLRRELTEYDLPGWWKGSVPQYLSDLKKDCHDYIPHKEFVASRQLWESSVGKTCNPSSGKVYDNGVNNLIGYQWHTHGKDKPDYVNIEHTMKEANGAQNQKAMAATQALYDQGTTATAAEWNLDAAPSTFEDVVEWCYDKCKGHSGAQFFALTTLRCGCFNSCDKVTDKSCYTLVPDHSLAFCTAMVKRVYNNILCRAPDKGGLDAKVLMCQNDAVTGLPGQDETAMEDGTKQSEEYKTKGCGGKGCMDPATGLPNGCGDVAKPQAHVAAAKKYGTAQGNLKDAGVADTDGEVIISTVCSSEIYRMPNKWNQ